MEAVRAAIAEGDTYQCNLTTRLRSSFRGDAFGLYGELAHRQRGGHHAFLDLGRHTVVSASPESFLHWEDGLLRTAPMKGTAARGRTPEEDLAAREALRASEKDRAENVMIVDLLRNDLARVCEAGSVQVTELLATEEYPTLWQLTSRIQGRARPEVGFARVFEALFPCGSITGAPKLSTMELIAELEDAPRGVYCGAIGYFAPGSAPRARFNVAIRTVVIDGADGSAVYGAGGGITWASTAADGVRRAAGQSQRSCRRRKQEPFALLETLAVHRRAGSASWGAPRADAGLGEHFGIPGAARGARGCSTRGGGSRRGAEADMLLRLALGRDGTREISSRPLTAPPPSRCGLSWTRCAPHSRPGSARTRPPCEGTSPRHVPGTPTLTTWCCSANTAAPWRPPSRPSPPASTAPGAPHRSPTDASPGWAAGAPSSGESWSSGR